jgi:hypothetical protein
MKQLERLAREFADDLSCLLNGTVTHGIRLRAVVKQPRSFVVGYNVAEKNVIGSNIPLSLGRKPAAYLGLRFTLEMDEFDRYLMVTKSTEAVYAGQDPGSVLVHYDYTREPDHGYPDPHVQVVGESEALAQIAGRRSICPTSLKEVHLPVGGRRFRPTVEDIIEMLIVEKMVEARSGWRNIIEHHRASWQEMQVKAAVRRHPSWAADALIEQGWAISGQPEYN